MKKRGAGSHSVDYNYSGTEKKPFHNQSRSGVFVPSSPSHAYGVAASEAGRDSTGYFSNNKKTYP